MKKTLSGFLRSPYFVLLSVFSVMLILNLSLTDRMDDFSFNSIYLEKGNIIDFLKYYAHIWSGRLIPHGIMVLLFQLPEFVFQFLNAAFITALLWISVYFCNDGKKPVSSRERILFLLFSISVFAVLPSEMLSSTVFWKSANVLYVWGLVASMVAILPFYYAYRERRTGIGLKLLSLCGAVYASNFEQTAPVVIAFAVILTGLTYWDKKKVPWFHYLLLVVSGVGMFISLKMPGNAVRFDAEIIAWMPYYDTFSFLDKIYFSMGYALQFMYQHFWLILWGIGVGTSFLVFRSRQNLIIRLTSLVPAGYFTLLAFSTLASTILGENAVVFSDVKHFLFNFASFNTERVFLSGSQMTSLLFGILSFVILTVLIYLHLSKEKNTLSALFFLASLFDLFILGFSPTIYASGIRVGFITGFFLLMVLFRLAFIFLKNRNRPIENGPFHNEIFV